MGIGNGQIDNDINIISGKKVVNGLGAQVEFTCTGLGRGHINISNGSKLQTHEERCEPQIGRRNIAAANDANTQIIHFMSPA